MISRLLDALNKVGLKPDGEEIADILWLALQMRISEPERVHQDQVNQPDSQDASSSDNLGSGSKIVPPQPQPQKRTPAPVKKTTPSAPLYTKDIGAPSGEQGSLTFKAPSAPSLQEPLQLGKALRPLMRRVLSRTETVLDEVATAERIAEEKILVPVLKPAPERWFDLALIADESPSMGIWRRTVVELQRLLERHGAFRNVQTWGLLTTQKGQIRLRSGIGAAARSRRLHTPNELLDPIGQRLFLVVSDCVSSMWRDGTVTEALTPWVKSGPLAIVQMLPEQLWERTALGLSAAVQLRSLTPGTPNQKLIAEGIASWDVVDLESGLKVPVVTLEPEPLTTWVQMVVGTGGAKTAGFIIELPRTVSSQNNIAQEEQSSPTLSAEQRVHRFLNAASPVARSLAGLLAAAPVISLPILRLIQRTMLQQSRQVHVAEVFLGGILKPESSIDIHTDPDYVQYGFVDEKIRSILLDAIPLSSSTKVLHEVSDFVAKRAGLSLQEFMAILQDPTLPKSEEVGKQIQPFAQVTAQVLRRLGGEYTRYAEQLERQVDLFKDKTTESSREPSDISNVTELQISEREVITPRNEVMMQYFHWYIPPGGMLWEEVKNQAADLAKVGFTALWLPPAYKGQGGGYDVGYGVYDLFDLGEFDQKGTVPTKYGTKEQFLAAIKAVQNEGMQVYADVVLNLRYGGDETERMMAIPFAKDNSTQPLGGSQEIEAYTRFNFPGRGDKYSSMKWNQWHFDAVNHNILARDIGGGSVYLLKGRNFGQFVDLERIDYGFLLGCYLDMDNLQVQGELEYWGQWFLDTTGVDGFRLDAVKNIPSWFFPQWLRNVRLYAQRNLFAVGEYWSSDVEALHWYISATEGHMSLFDVPLHYNFHRASRSGGHYDMGHILDGTLMQEQPALAVTFVDNHDSQPLQALESVVEPWFKPLAYAIILLRREGYPCVFYADYYGAHYKDRGYEIWLDSHRWLIDKLLYARKHYTYGTQHDYFDHPDIIGWTFSGDENYSLAMAVLMSDGSGGSKWMETGKPNKVFLDILENIKDPVQTNEQGWGEFRCNGGSVSVWLMQP